MNISTMTIATAVALALGSAACDRDRSIGEPAPGAPETAAPAGTPTAGTPATVSPGAIAKNPATYTGKEVRVVAEVAEVHGAHAFTLDEDEAFAGPDVLVLVASTVTDGLEGENVTVRGTVRQYDRAAFERDHAWFDPDALGDTDFGTRPVIIATMVRGADGEEIASSGPAPRAPAEPDAP